MKPSLITTHPSALIAIVGPTASGKTALSLLVAQQFDGEIICADSRTVYRGMDIGTAKPSKADQEMVSHHLLDIRDADQSYNAAEFQRDARLAIAEIRSRGKLPIVVGGTGLYVDALLYNFDFPSEPDLELHHELAAMPLLDLVELLRAIDPDVEEQVDTGNRRRVIRAIESVGQKRIRKPLRSDALVLGVYPGKEAHELRMRERNREWMREGLAGETRELLQEYGSDIAPINMVPYREILRCLSGEWTEQQALEAIDIKIRQLAKRQMTWFRRNKDIQWMSGMDEAIKIINAVLKQTTPPV